MSNTPTARKAAARQHQREHGGSYTAALAAVSPEAAAASRQGSAVQASDAATEAIRAVRFFDEATTDVVGQSLALGRLRTLLGQHVVAAHGQAGDRIVVDIGASVRGLWEDTICIAFAQAWMLGTTGVAAEVLAAEPKNGVTWVGDVAIHDVALPPGDELGKCRLLLRYKLNKFGSDYAVSLRQLKADEMVFVAMRSLAEKVDGPLGFTGDDVAERVASRFTGTGDAARDIVDKALARALIRSNVDEPGSPTGVTIDDVAEGFAFLGGGRPPRPAIPDAAE